MNITRIISLTLLFCCAAVAGKTTQVNPKLGNTVGSVKVTGRGAVDSPDAKFCSRFSLSNANARRYLRSATVINTNERHYQFLWSPCFVEGTAVIAGETVHWRIEALGLGSIAYPDGTERLLGDERQRDRNGQ